MMPDDLFVALALAGAALFFAWTLGSMAHHLGTAIKWKLLSLKLLYWAWKDAWNETDTD